MLALAPYLARLSRLRLLSLGFHPRLLASFCYVAGSSNSAINKHLPALQSQKQLLLGVGDRFTALGYTSQDTFSPASTDVDRYIEILTRVTESGESCG